MKIEEIKLCTKLLGKKIIYEEEMDSTQDYANRNREELPSGTVVIADKQINGKGTKGRSWYTGSSDNIAMTILWKPNCKIDKLEGFTRKIAENIKQTIEQYYQCSLTIKEPNDLLLKGKKIAGILTQTSTNGETVQYLLIGIGFNVNEESFSEETALIATSLKKEMNKKISREEVITHILEELEKIIKF